MQGAEAYILGEQNRDVTGGTTGLRALEEALAHRLSSFYRTAHKFLGNAADAEDAVQDGLLSAYQHLHEFRGEAQMSTWLTVIVTNCARMQLRRRTRRAYVSFEEQTCNEEEYSILERLADKRPTPEDECAAAEVKARLTGFAERLSPVLRRTFQLYALQGLSNPRNSSHAGDTRGHGESAIVTRKKKTQALHGAEHSSAARNIAGRTLGSEWLASKCKPKTDGLSSSCASTTLRAEQQIRSLLNMLHYFQKRDR